MKDAEDGVDLSIWIEQLRGELLKAEIDSQRRAATGNPDQLRFEVERVELDLVIRTEYTKPKLIRFKVLTDENIPSTTTVRQRVKFILRPYGIIILGEESSQAAHSEGELRGRRAALARILTHRKFVISYEQRARIEGCIELERLDLWIERSIEALTVDEVFEE